MSAQPAELTYQIDVSHRIRETRCKPSSSRTFECGTGNPGYCRSYLDNLSKSTVSAYHTRRRDGSTSVPVVGESWRAPAALHFPAVELTRRIVVCTCNAPVHSVINGRMTTRMAVAECTEWRRSRHLESPSAMLNNSGSCRSPAGLLTFFHPQKKRNPQSISDS